MTLQTFTPTYPPSEGTQDKPKFKLLKAEFGDGYTQVARDGVNHIRRVLNLTWEVLTPNEAAYIVGFIRAHGGDTPFWYTPSDEISAVKWTCEDYSDTRNQGGLRTVTATFEQSFNLLTTSNVPVVTPVNPYSPPVETGIFVVDSDGAQIVDSDGAYIIMEA